MVEIEQALNTQGRYLSPILLSEGGNGQGNGIPRGSITDTGCYEMNLQSEINQKNFMPKAPLLKHAVSCTLA